MRKYEIYQNIRAILSIFSHMGSLKKITLIIFLTIISCSKEDEFPDIHVNESIFIASGGVGSAEYINFYGNLYAWDIIPGGLGGIIIVQGHNDTFMAYDRACTHENTSQNINSNCIISDITHISFSSLYSLSSKALNVSLGLEFLTIISPSILSAS